MTGRGGDYRIELDAALAAATAAGAIHRAYLAAGGAARATKPDGTPVTAADVEADATIVAILHRWFPRDAIVSEEAPDDGLRFARRRVWLVDPLDGTRDFLAGTGEFAVHVALVVDGAPAVAVVYQPVADRMFHATAGQGAYERIADADHRLRVSGCDDERRFLIGVTRLGPTPELDRFRAGCELATGLIEIGASLKLIAVARGVLDASLALSACEREWDTCAPDLIVTEAGGCVTDLDGAPLRYNQRDLYRRRGLVASNGRRHAALVDRVRPYAPAVAA